MTTYHPGGFATNPTRLKIALAVIALIVGCFLIYRQTAGRTMPVPVIWYYDLNTGKLFTHRMEDGPVAAPSGAIDGKPAGVRAFVFAGGQCGDESARFAAWLETLGDAPAPGSLGAADPASSASDGAVMRPPGMDGPDGRPRLIKRPTDKAWVGMDSEQAGEIQTVKPCADGSAATQCVQP